MPEDARTASRTAAVLRLLDDSYTAHRTGKRHLSHDYMQAAVKLDVDVVSVILGGITIGEIPNPEHDVDGWRRYVDAVTELAQQ